MNLECHRVVVMWTTLVLASCAPFAGSNERASRSESAVADYPGADFWIGQQHPLGQITVPEAWGVAPGPGSTTKGSPNTHVCVIATGFDLQHSEFAFNNATNEMREIRLY
ncbi:MAG: hypothetical protein JRH20_29725, partial [Deltaproteobacteria bacterium]|nr:hypothetical protein [Deltaproteobacteria bacterium]